MNEIPNALGGVLQGANDMRGDVRFGGDMEIGVDVILPLGEFVARAEVGVQ